MNESPNFEHEEGPLFSRLEPSDLNAEGTSRKFYQFIDGHDKVIRVDSFDDLSERYGNMVSPDTVIELGKKLFQEIQASYDIKVPVEIINDKNGDNKDAVYIITDKIDGIALEEAEETPEFLKKLEDLYVSISRYYLDKLNSGEVHLADLNSESQYIYDKRKGDAESEIYLVDTDLYLNKGDAALLHNVKWLIRHMPKKFVAATENIIKILETPLSNDLSDEDREAVEREIKESLDLLEGIPSADNGKDEAGFIPAALN